MGHLIFNPNWLVYPVRRVHLIYLEVVVKFLVLLPKIFLWSCLLMVAVVFFPFGILGRKRLR